MWISGFQPEVRGPSRGGLSRTDHSVWLHFGCLFSTVYTTVMLEPQNTQRFENALTVSINSVKCNILKALGLRLDGDNGNAATVLYGCNKQFFCTRSVDELYSTSKSWLPVQTLLALVMVHTVLVLVLFLPLLMFIVCSWQHVCVVLLLKQQHQLVDQHENYTALSFCHFCGNRHNI